MNNLFNNLTGAVEAMSLKELDALREAANAEYEKRQMHKWEQVVTALTDYMAEFGGVMIYDRDRKPFTEIVPEDNFDEPGKIF